MCVNGEIHNAQNLYTIVNIATIVTRGNFTKEAGNFQSIEKEKTALLRKP